MRASADILQQDTPQREPIVSPGLYFLKGGRWHHAVVEVLDAETRGRTTGVRHLQLTDDEPRGSSVLTGPLGRDHLSWFGTFDPRRLRIRLETRVRGTFAG